MKVFLGSFESPLGPMELACSAEALISAEFVAERTAQADRHPLLELCASQLQEYFRGLRRDFSLPLEPVGTPFQHEVWAALMSLRFGETSTYGDVAAGLGRSDAARAVGSAVARNPLAIVIPCHRVVGKDGDLTGYAWGTWRKEWLLRREQEALIEYQI